MRGNGGRIGPKHTPTTGSASGVWSLAEAGDYQKQSLWPTMAPPELYAFTNATFTPGGQTGSAGPSLAQARTGLTGTGVDAWKNNTSYFNTTNGIQLWTVPATGTYRIEAFGSQGASNTASGGTAGGLGARMRGDFSLVQGEIIRILVGQRLNFSNTCGGGGGGGGSFVVRDPYNTTGSILVIAGGGGGGGMGSNVASGGTTSNNGNPGSGSPAGAGGSNGNGGGIPSGGCSGPEGSGGGGFSGNGTSNGTSGGGISFTNGGDGGTGSRTGGFGGGGGVSNYGGSGGGGYSGGGGGGLGGSCTCNVMNGGGGGGSYNAGTNQSNSSGVRTDQGQVIITKL
jgi:hypothetical protein